MADSKKKKVEDGSLEGPSSLIEPTEADKKDSHIISQDESTLIDSSVDNETPAPAKKSKPVGRLLGSLNLYFIIFVLLLILAAGGIFASVKFNSKNASKSTTKTDSLTDKQLTDLKTNTTIVGDAQQTLDIQGNSIFEGQVLMRNNLDVAGSLKVGGSLSLPAITVGGSSTFGQIHVNDQLSVSGNTILQGSLTVQKGLNVSGAVSFSSLSASQITASSLQLTGDFVVNRHINVSGGSPGRSGGTALGAGGTVSVSGTDTAGTVSINTGGSPPAGCFVTMGFTQRFSSTPHVVISPSNSSASTLNYYASRSNTALSICTTSAPAASTTYVFDYITID
jgi:cytoskeletal protein CcmA (bactofilin family)